VVSWKLSEFIPAANGQANQGAFAIAGRDFARAAQECIRKNPGIRIIAAPAYSRDGGCLIVSAQGHLMKPDKNTLVDLGKLTELDDSVLFDGFSENMNASILRATYRTK
jgi:hypothetical protein